MKGTVMLDLLAIGLVFGLASACAVGVAALIALAAARHHARPRPHEDR